MNRIPWRRDVGHFTAMRHDEAGMQRVLEAARRLEGWARAYPEINPKRIYSTCLCLAEPAPSLDVGDLVAAAKGVLWIFCFDDLVDEGDLTSQTIAPLVERYSQIACGAIEATIESARDPLGTLLQEVCEALHHNDLFAAARSYWSQGLSDTLYAMLQEQKWREQYLIQGVQPSYPEYIENGLKSIAGSPYIWMALIGLGDPSVLRHAAYLDRQMRHAAVCIRLANDLRSYLKELSEGNINSVTIRAAEEEYEGLSRATAVKAARRWVNREIYHQLTICERNSHDVRTATGYPEQAIRNFARWNVEFYRRQGHLTCQPGAELKNYGWTSRQS